LTGRGDVLVRDEVEIDVDFRDRPLGNRGERARLDGARPVALRWAPW